MGTSTVAGAAPLVAETTWLDLMFPDADEIREHAPIVQPLVLVLVFSLAATAALRPAVLAAFPGPDRSMGSALQTWLWIVAAASPLIAIVKAGLVTAVVWAVAVLADDDVAARPALSTVAFAELVPVLGAGGTALFLQMRGLSRIVGPADLRPPFTFDVWFGLESDLWVAIAQPLSVIYVGWFLFLIVALPRTAGIRRGTAALGVGLTWLTLVGFAALRTLL